MSTAYRFGKVQVCPDARQVWVGGSPAALAGRAFDLLVALIEHRDRVVGKHELLDLVWPGACVEESNLHTQVSNVRRTVGRGAIATVSGRGYRFVAPLDVIRLAAGPDADEAPVAGVAERRGEPSIGVLPFVNLSGDPEQEYFSDGVSEDIVNRLSRAGGLMVVARNSSFEYKIAEPDLRAVGRELGVAKVLQGTVRRNGRRLRITARLSDVESGARLWGERYDRDVDDIFVIQDDVTRHIVGALTDWLSSQESQRSLTVGTRSFEAHDHLLRGRELMRGPDGVTRENVEQIIAAIERAIALDPDYSLPYADLAVLHCIDYQNRLTGNPNPLDAALHCAEEALDRGPDDPEAHFAAANVAIWRHDLAAARAETERALALNPNYAMAYGMRGNIDVYLGTPESAVLDFQHALRLDPFFKHQTLHFLGTAYLVCADYEAAVAAFRARIELNRKTDLSRGFLIAALGHLGLVREARRVIGELKQINPNYSLAEHLARLPFQAEAHRERIRAGAVKAGYAS